MNQPYPSLDKNRAGYAQYGRSARRYYLGVGWPGLIKMAKDGTILRTWTPKEGLYDPECRRVLVDAQNRVWIGTYDGLHQFDTRKNTFRRFTVNDGLLSNNTMMGLCLTNRNELLIGNMGGWNTLDMTVPRPVSDDHPATTDRGPN